MWIRAGKCLCDPAKNDGDRSVLNGSQVGHEKCEAAAANTGQDYGESCMKRFMNPALVAIAAFATFGLAACGSDAKSEGTTTADTTSGSTDDTTIGTDATSGGTDATTPDIKVPCGGACKTGETCNKTTDKCEALPCGGACKTGEKCGTDNKCYIPCGGPCKADEYCDEATAPGTCKATAAMPTKWGVGDDGQIQKVITLAITDKTKACDMNGDGTPDNALAGAASLIGSSLSDAVKKGSVVLMFEPKTYKTDGTDFTFNVLIGDVDAADAATVADPNAAGGKFTVKKETYDPATGKSLVTFNKANIKAGKLTAKADKFFLNLNISSIALALTIQAVDFSGDTTDGTSWKTTTGGRLCGYITETDLNNAIDALPADLLAQFGGKDAVKKLLPTLIKSDVDSDGDGIKDAKSLALDIDTLSGSITGYTPVKAP